MRMQNKIQEECYDDLLVSHLVLDWSFSKSCSCFNLLRKNLLWLFILHRRIFAIISFLLPHAADSFSQRSKEFVFGKAGVPASLLGQEFSYSLDLLDQ